MSPGSGWLTVISIIAATTAPITIATTAWKRFAAGLREPTSRVGGRRRSTRARKITVRVSTINCVIATSGARAARKNIAMPSPLAPSVATSATRPGLTAAAAAPATASTQPSRAARLTGLVTAGQARSSPVEANSPISAKPAIASTSALMCWRSEPCWKRSATRVAKANTRFSRRSQMRSPLTRHSTRHSDRRRRSRVRCR
jgi:hypothetical protein